MARRPTTDDDPTLGLERIRKEQGKTRPRARLRIMIATDPDRPIRTISLPRRLPLVASVITAILLLATIVLACTSWSMRDGLASLQRRVRAMVQAADSVALAPEGDGRHGVVLAHTTSLAAHGPSGEVGRFVMQSVNTGEEMDVAVNLSTGELDESAYRQLRHIMRCQRTTAETPIDPRLIELLFRISQRTHQKIMLVSGFRAPMFSIATLSYHTRGMAADIRIPGMTPLMVRDLVASMGVRGIGYYPVSGFVHVDVRDEISTWTDYGQNRQDGEGTEHGPARSRGGDDEPTEAAEPAEPAAPGKASPDDVAL